jgi:hypothetical protein
VNRLRLGVIIAAALLGACANDSDTTSDDTPISGETTTTASQGQRFPEILDAQATRDTNGAWTFAVTISSPYDSPQRYADAWRVLGGDGTEYGLRILTHDHAAEQPFTRSLAGVEISGSVDHVQIEARDLVNGWSGTTFELLLPPS